jgi:hypothetical protein
MLLRTCVPSSTLPDRVFMLLAAICVVGVLSPSVGMAQSGTAQTRE